MFPLPVGSSLVFICTLVFFSSSLASLLLAIKFPLVDVNLVNLSAQKTTSGLSPTAGSCEVAQVGLGAAPYSNMDDAFQYFNRMITCARQPSRYFNEAFTSDRDVEAGGFSHPV